MLARSLDSPQGGLESDLMVASSNITCPLCESIFVRKTGQRVDMAIYMCETCKAHFTVHIPGKPGAE